MKYLIGEELSGGGDDLTVDQVFGLVSDHNKMLASEDRFSTTPLRLVFRSSAVQNMRFVDTPGIISNRSDGGKDNRVEIMSIIRNELRRVNPRLCVLLEATEFAKNPIVDFLDEDLGGRNKWISNATFLMPKRDKQLSDTKSATNANNFFRGFHINKLYPHLVITPTLDKEDLETGKILELMFHDPAALQLIVSRMLSDVESRLNNYLDGDLESSLKFPDRLQSLNDEIEEEEEESDWCQRDLNFHSDREEEWRDQIVAMAENYPEEIQPMKKFLGGKQFQRAIELFRTVMVESLSDPFALDHQCNRILEWRFAARKLGKSHSRNSQSLSKRSFTSRHKLFDKACRSYFSPALSSCP